MMRKKYFSSKFKILFLMFCYYQIIVLFVLAIILLIGTNGMMSSNIKNNIFFLLIPASLPILFSLIGIHQIITYSDDDLLKIKSTNVFLSLTKDRIKNIQIPKLPTIKVHEQSKYFGLKKILIIKIKPKTKHILNVSILSESKRKELIDSIYSMKID